MIERYVIDTNSLIFSNAQIFDQDLQHLSEASINIIRNAMFDLNSHYRITIPSVVFTEIHKLFFHSEEFIKKFFYEIFKPITDSAFLEIREIDKEVLEWTIKIESILSDHEINDKIIVASAIALESPLITTDTEIQDFARENPDLLTCLN